MALTADTVLTEVIDKHSESPVLSAATIYEGAMLGDSAGYVRGLVALDKFRGHALEHVDNPSGGDRTLEHLTGRYRLKVTLTGVVITDVGQPVYASADDILTFSAPGNSFVGIVVRYVAANTAIVEFRPGELDEFGLNPNRVLKSTDYTALLADSGKIIYVDTDTKVITLTAIATLLSGYEITVVNAGVGILIAVDPTTDLISGGCGLGPGGGGKQFRNTAATAKRGDFIKLAGNATGWSIIDLRGTWAIEA